MKRLMLAVVLVVVSQGVYAQGFTYNEATLTYIAVMTTVIAALLAANIFE